MLTSKGFLRHIIALGVLCAHGSSFVLTSTFQCSRTSIMHKGRNVPGSSICLATMSGKDEITKTKSKDSFTASRREILGFGMATFLGTTPLFLSTSEANAQLPGLDLLDTAGQRPAGLGPVAGERFLTLCNNENCVSTSEDVYSKRYLPPWTYNDEGKKPKTPAQAKEDLLKVLSNFKEAKIVTVKDNYIYCEFQREFGFVDDVEFLFAPDNQTVEYRSAARKSSKSDHRGRIKKLRLALQEKGWRSIGYRCASYTYNAMGDMLCRREAAPPQLRRDDRILMPPSLDADGDAAD